MHTINKKKLEDTISSYRTMSKRGFKEDDWLKLDILEIILKDILSCLEETEECGDGNHNLTPDGCKNCPFKPFQKIKPTKLEEIRENYYGKIFTYSMGQQKEDVKYLLSLIDKKTEDPKLDELRAKPVGKLTPEDIFYLFDIINDL